MVGFKKTINNFLSDKLGDGKETFQGLKFNCPICDGGNKYNLEVNLNERNKNFLKFNCWACKYSGHIRKLLTDYSYEDNWRDIEILKNQNNFINTQKIEVKKVKLPNNCIPVTQNKKALEYLLKEREISIELINERNLLFHEDSIIFPFYENNELISYSSHNLVTKAYKNFSTTNRVFYKEFINNRFPIIVTEGFYDCFSAPNSIPLAGVIVGTEVYKFCSGKNVILALDNEVSIQDKLKICEEFDYYGVNKIIIFDTQKYKDLNQMYIENKNVLKNNLQKTINFLLNA